MSEGSTSVTSNNFITSYFPPVGFVLISGFKGLMMIVIIDWETNFHLHGTFFKELKRAERF